MNQPWKIPVLSYLHIEQEKADITDQLLTVKCETEAMINDLKWLNQKHTNWILRKLWSLSAVFVLDFFCGVHIT